MAALQVLDVSGCKQLSQQGWLPTSSAAALLTLDVSSTCVTRVPGGLSLLRELNVALADDWLPPSSMSALQTLEAARAKFTRPLPEGLVSLQKLNVAGCTQLFWTADQWLPTSCAALVRELNVSEAPLTRLPTLPALERLDVSGCIKLVDGWLSENSVRHVITLDTSRCRLERLPEGMQALESLSVKECPSLAPNWLPASSAACLTSLEARLSNMTALPAAATSLREVLIKDSDCCLHADGLPAGAPLSLITIDGVDCADYVLGHRLDEQGRLRKARTANGKPGALVR